jgi:hypothetical protein
MPTRQAIAAGATGPIYVNETQTTESIAPVVYINETIASGATLWAQSIT